MNPYWVQIFKGIDLEFQFVNKREVVALYINYEKRMSKADYIALLPRDTRYQIVGMRRKAVPTALASIIRKDISQLLLDGLLSMEDLWI